jgi:tRNA 2-selenouridine synthase
VYFIEIPFLERLAFVEKNYGLLEIDKLIEAVIRIQKRFGPLETKTTLQLLQEKKSMNCYTLLLWNQQISNPIKHN